MGGECCYVEAMQLGPFYVNMRLLAVLISGAAAYAVIFGMLRCGVWRNSPLGEIVLNTLMIGLAAWKLAPFLLQPSLLWTSPLKGILMIGGARETFIGGTIAIAYMLLTAMKEGVSLRLLSDSLAYGMIAFWIVHAVLGGWHYGKLTGLPWGISLGNPDLRYHPLNVYELLAAVLLGSMLIFGRMKLGEGRAGRIGFLGVGAGGFAISLFAMGSPFGVILTGGQWMALLGAGLGLILPRMYILWEAYQERRGYVMADEDSKAAKRQERHNKQAGQTEPEQKGYDKKLDGPNKPST